MSKAKAIIRKYSNRRLYDTASSRYVNLLEIARMIREGSDVEVIDTRGKDVTRTILTQIIVEESREHGSGLPQQLLQQLIMASDRATHEVLSRYLHVVLDLYQKAQSAIRTRVSDATASVGSPLDLLRQVLAGAGAWPPPEEEPVKSPRASRKSRTAPAASSRVKKTSKARKTTAKKTARSR